jgi:hypothetical protein
LRENLKPQALQDFAFSFNGQQLGCGHGTFEKGD